MHLFFIDESGTPPKPTAPNPRPYFVIAGVAIPGDSWHSLSEDLRNLKNDTRFQISGEIKWRFFGEQNPEKHNSLSHLSQETRNEFRSEFFSLIVRRPEIKIIACVTSVAAAYETSYVNSDDDIYEYTYKPISERFQYYLQEVSTKDDKSLGLMICDHRGRNQDERLRAHHLRLLHSSAPHFSAYQNFVETLFLTPSHQSVGIQFADMITGAIGRYFNSKDNFWAKKIAPSFRRSPWGKIQGYGLVKFPKNGWK